jgi:AcrR family transcriptional regulator
MGIPERKQKEKERRRQQILVAAKRVFSEKGFTKATIEEIAKSAELSSGTLYLYFRNKEELWVSLSLRVLQYLLMRLEHIDDGLEPQEKLRALKEVLYDVYEFDPSVAINMFHLQSSDILKNLSPEMLSEITGLTRQALDKISGIFQEGIREGSFVDRHPVALTDIVWGMFSGVVLWENSKNLLNRERDYLRPTLELAFELLERGVRKGS